LASQTLEWSLPVYETISIDDQHPKIYRTYCSININSKIITSDIRIDYSKKKSEQLAALNLLEKYLGIEIKHEEKIIEQRNIVEKPDENYKGILQNKCQKNQLRLPTYKHKQEGSPHDPVFTVIAEISIGDKIIYSEPAKGPNIKTAEQLAAKNMLEKFQSMNIQENQNIIAESENNSIAAPHFISCLQEFYQGTDLPLPKYGYEDHATGFTCTCTTVSTDGTAKEFSASGSNKKTAKRNAAKLAYDAMKDLFDAG
ncbi:MAG: putative dsRNA-binding protein, partial [bacterium]